MGNHIHQIFSTGHHDTRVQAMAAAAVTLCYMSHGCSFSKLSQYHHLNKQINITTCNYRIHRVGYVQHALRKPLIRLHSIQVHNRLWKCRAKHTETHIGDDDKEENNISKATLIWRAIKLPIYTVAFIPISVGSAAAYLHTGHYFAKRYITLLISSFLVIAWLNLSNDVYDFDTGADENKKESVVNLLGSQTGTHIVAWLFLAIGFTGLIRVSLEAGSSLSAILLSCAIICGYIYQCPPFRLSYKGLGEPLCFAAFGPLATTAFYLLQSGTREQSISRTVVSSSVLVGLTTSLILFCSHFHQIEDDKAVGKLSPLVMLGTEAGAKLVKVAVTTLYSLVLVLGVAGSLPFSSLILCALTLPMGSAVVSFVEKNHMDKEKIFMAKYYCVRLHTVFGAAMAVGLLATRLLARKQLPSVVLL